MECLSFCIANSFDLSRLDAHFKSLNKRYISSRSRDILKITEADSDNHIHIFNNGTVITWGIKRHRVNALLDIIRQFANRPISFLVHDEFSYTYGDLIAIGPHDYFDVDRIILNDADEQIKVAFSYGLSQSVKLQYFERTIEKLIDKYTPIIYAQPKSGKIPISRKEIRVAIADIISANAELNLMSNFFYHPKYFWQHPTMEEYFIMIERYMHIQRRVHAINHRLDKLNEIFDMFNSYLENRHGVNLEITVILLITIEIISSVLNFHF
jgi:uncharacterized Rmd1/YagE family protein